MISSAVGALADTALLLPASILLLAYLGWLRQGRLMASWVLALGLAGTATVAAKLVFHACGRTLTDGDVISPSGHASFAVIFYGALAVLFGTGRSPAVRLILSAATVVVVIGVGVSRIRTGAHSLPEVAIGIALGALALAAFALLHARAGEPTLPWAPVVGGFAVAVLLLGGLHLSLEPMIGRLARQVSATLDICTGPERTVVGRLLPGR